MWLTPPKAAADGRWPLTTPEIRVRCEKYRLAVERGRTPSPDSIRCIRDRRGYRIQDIDLDAWLRRQYQ